MPKPGRLLATSMRAEVLDNIYWVDVQISKGRKSEFNFKVCIFKFKK